jgi:hypothetical protein
MARSRLPEVSAMLRTVLVATILVAALPAFAQDRTAIRAACKADFARNCPGVQPGGGKLIACFKEKRAQFSEGCRTAMQSARASGQANGPRAACQADFTRNCPGVKPGGGRLVACFKEKQAQFSEGCRTAMQSARARGQAN